MHCTSPLLEPSGSLQNVLSTKVQNCISNGCISASIPALTPHTTHGAVCGRQTFGWWSPTARFDFRENASEGTISIVPTPLLSAPSLPGVNDLFSTVDSPPPAVSQDTGEGLIYIPISRPQFLQVYRHFPLSFPQWWEFRHLHFKNSYKFLDRFISSSATVQRFWL